MGKKLRVMISPNRKRTGAHRTTTWEWWVVDSCGLIVASISENNFLSEPEAMEDWKQRAERLGITPDKYEFMEADNG